MFLFERVHCSARIRKGDMARNKMILALTVGVCAVVAFVVWLIFSWENHEFVEAAIRRCVNERVITGGATKTEETQTRASIAKMENEWGVSAREAATTLCGRSPD